MSELPSKWLDVELSEVAEFIRGVTYKREQAADAPQEGFLPVLRATNITGAALAFDGLVYVPTSNISGEQFLQPGDVVIASSSGSKEIVGKAGTFAGGSFVGSFGAFCTGIRPSSALSAAYFGYYFQTPSYRKSVSDLAAGSNINNLKTGDLASQRFPFPPAAEQTRIVAKLEELLSDLDAGVAELKAAQKKLGQYRQSLLKAAVEGALTAEWRAKSTPSETGAQLLERILQERRARWEAKQLAKFAEQGKTPPKDWQKKYPEPVQPDTTGLPELPQGWVWASVVQVGEVQLGRQRAPQFHSGENMVPYLRVANVFEERIDVSDVMEMHFSKEDEASFLLSPGDVLLNEGQSLELVGRPAIYRGELPRACFTNTLVRFRAESGVLAEYAIAVFLHYMHSGRFRKIAKITTNIAHLGAGRFAELEFPRPSTNEQIEIVRLLQAGMEQIQRQGSAIALALKQSTAQRQNILRAAFSGQLVPQDPNDEPASVLLERIRGERAQRDAVKKPRGRKVKEAA